MDQIDDVDLDDILDSALEEFEEEELAKVSRQAVGGQSNGPRVDDMLKHQQKDEATQQLHQMIADFEDPEKREALQYTFSHLSGHVEGAETLDQFLETLKEKERASAQGGSAIRGDPLHL